MTVLITGAAGFLGKNLWRELEQRGHRVVGVDRSPDQINGFPYAFEGRCLRADLLDPQQVELVFEAVRPEVVIHLAAQVGRLFGDDDQRHTLRSNAEMTMLVARACAVEGARMVYASTSEVYGDQGGTVCSEYGPMLVPHNLYGLSKRFGEELCQLLVPDGLVILRFSMPYGIGVPPGRGRAAITNVMWQAATGQDIPIHRGAERSWCWVGDTVRGVAMILESGRDGAWNVGRDDAAISMYDLAIKALELVAETNGVPFDRGQDYGLKLIDPPKAQTVVKRLSTDRLRSLGWEPEVELDEGLPIVLDWVRQFDAGGRRIASSLAQV